MMSGWFPSLFLDCVVFCAGGLYLGGRVEDEIGFVVAELERDRNRLLICGCNSDSRLVWMMMGVVPGKSRAGSLLYRW